MIVFDMSLVTIAALTFFVVHSYIHWDDVLNIIFPIGVAE